MYILVSTVKYPLTVGKENETFKESYELCDTMQEAQEAKQRLIALRPNGLVNYAICEVLEASERSWVEKKENWGTDV